MPTTFAVVRTTERGFQADHTESYVDYGRDRTIGPPWTQHSWSMSTGTLDKHGVKLRRYRNPPPRPGYGLPEPLADWERELLGEEREPRITFEVRNEW